MIDESTFPYKVNIYRNEVFYLPAYWYHQVINGKYNTFAVNLWTVNKLSNKITTYQFATNIKQNYLLNVNKLKNWKYILYYFIHNLLHQYDLFLLSIQYFAKLYPVLNDIQQHHQMIIGYDTNQWLFWFIDIENILKCYADNELVNDIINNRYESTMCPFMTNDNDERIFNEWNIEIKKILAVIRDIEDFRGDQVAQIELAEFIEKVLFMITNDVTFHPLIVALYFL